MDPMLELTPKGDLDLSRCKSEVRIPMDIEVPGDFIVRDCVWFKRLPWLPLVKGDFHLEGSGLREIPAGFRAPGSVFAQDCLALESVGMDCETGGALVLSRCPALLEIGPRLRTGNSLVLEGCARLALIGRDPRIHGNLVLRDCARLHYLPSDAIVWGRVEVANSGLRDLPLGLSTDKLAWQGQPATYYSVFYPENIRAEDILSEPNAQYRAVLLERYGLEAFLESVAGQVLDQDLDLGGQRRLIKIDFSLFPKAQASFEMSDEPEPAGLEDNNVMLCLQVRCPSTKSAYILRVPPWIETCVQAAAWVAGFKDEDEYRPVAET